MNNFNHWVCVKILVNPQENLRPKDERKMSDC